MKNNFIVHCSLFIVHFFLFSSCSSSDIISVYDLRCEYMSEPLGIDDPYRFDESVDYRGFSPRISWKVTGNKNAVKQTAYRVTVSNRLKGPLVWDSGVVETDDQFCFIPDHILQSGKTYYWKVGVYSRRTQSLAGSVQANTMSEGETPSFVWSKSARFSTGLLQADWKGEWISHPSAAGESHIWYRKTFTLSGVQAKSDHYYAYVASMGYHELYVNGKKVDDRVLAPAISRIDKRVLYVTYDISRLLRKGQNTVAISYGPGWSMNNYFARRNTTQAIRVQIADDQNRFLLYSDTAWLCSDSYSKNSGRFDFMDMGGELVDGRLYNDRWMTPGFDDSQWQRAVKKEMKILPILTSQMTDPTRILETIPAIKVTEIIDQKEQNMARKTIYRVDMGKQFTGFLEARFEGLSSGDTVEIMVSMRDSNPELVEASYGIGDKVIEEQKQKQIYIARGEDGEMFVNRFNFFAGRYIHFRGLKEAPKLQNIKGLVLSSAPEATSTFACSDSLYNQIYAIDMYTYRMCHTEGVVVDCPNRERLGYGPEGAYQTMWGLGLPCFNSAAYYIKNVRDWGDVQREDGFINNVAPQISIMYGCVLNGTAILNTAWEHYRIYGDKRILAMAYPVGVKWLEYLDKYTQEAMLTRYARRGYFLGDWVSPGPVFEYAETEEALYFNNCVYAMTLDHIINIGQALGVNHVDIIKYSEKRDALRLALHQKYYNPELESYLNGDQVRTSFALYAGLVPDDLTASVNNYFNKLLREQQYINVGSFGRYPFYKTILEKPGYMEILGGILAGTTYPSYGYFLKEGCTTLPEMWEIDRPNSTVIHTSYTGISAFFIKGLAGIGEGNDTIRIAPKHVNRISWCKAGIETQYGRVESSWKKDETGNITYSFTIPFGMVAIIKLENETEKIVNAGTYNFNSH